MTEHVSMPPAWADLAEAITILGQHPTDPVSPLHCEHDRLNVLADDKAFTSAELARLAGLGFHVSAEGGFHSYRFGSA